MSGFFRQYKKVIRLNRARKTHTHRQQKKKLKQVRTTLIQLEQSQDLSKLNPTTLLITIQKYIDHLYKPNIDEEKELINIIKESKIELCPHKITKGETRQFWLYLLRRGDLYCDLCGQKINKPSELNYDHKIPQSRGGKTSVDNARPTHPRCNSIKTNILPDKWQYIGKGILNRYGICVDLLHAGYDYRGR